jgi:hypothetical protein
MLSSISSLAEPTVCRRRDALSPIGFASVLARLPTPIIAPRLLHPHS